jgi:hypothetical protein
MDEPLADAVVGIPGLASIVSQERLVGRKAPGCAHCSVAYENVRLRFSLAEATHPPETLETGGSSLMDSGRVAANAPSPLVALATLPKGE